MPLRRLSGRGVLCAAVLLAVAAPASVHAQATAGAGAPAAGTWGAEVGVGRFDDATVLRFLSPSWAVLVGGSMQSTNTAGTGSARVPGRTDVAIKAGLRKYHRNGLGLRPITGAGITLDNYPGGAPWYAYGEAGAAYLFTRHLALGAVGIASFSRDGDRNTFGLVVPRVFASIFF